MPKRMGFQCKKSSLAVKHTRVTFFLTASFGSYLQHCYDTRSSAIGQAQIKTFIMTLTQLKNSVYNISTTLFIPHPVSFSPSFSQNSGLVQLVLTPVAIWSNIYEVWVWLKERLMIVSCSPVNMSGLISECPTLTLLQADFESKYILRVSLANRKSPRQFTVFFFSQVYTLSSTLF